MTKRKRTRTVIRTITFSQEPTEQTLSIQYDAFCNECLCTSVIISHLKQYVLKFCLIKIEFRATMYATRCSILITIECHWMWKSGYHKKSASCAPYSFTSIDKHQLNKNLFMSISSRNSYHFNKPLTFDRLWTSSVSMLQFCTFYFSTRSLIFKNKWNQVLEVVFTEMLLHSIEFGKRFTFSVAGIAFCVICCSFKYHCIFSDTFCIQHT